MKRYVAHVAREVRLGIQDNFSGIKQLVLHPIVSVLSMGRAILNPIQTVKSIYSSAISSPWRFGTNVAVSILEGQAASWAVGRVTALNTQASALETVSTLPVCVSPSYTNATLVLQDISQTQASTMLNYFPNVASAKPSLRSLSVCSGDTCTFAARVQTSASASLFENTAVVSTTNLNLDVGTRRKHKKK